MNMGKDPKDYGMSGNSQVASPYLNFNPAFVTSGSETDYLYPEWSSGSTGRGRFELMFSTIGGFAAAGAVLGGANGLYTGWSATRIYTGSERRTRLINSLAKGSASWAQMCGVVALMYSGSATILQKVRGHDDELNTLAAGTLSGLLFKSSGGLMSCMRGGLTGLGVTAIYVGFTSRERLKTMFGR